MSNRPNAFNPEKYTLPKSGNNVVFSLRIDENVYELTRKVANLEGRSINAQLLRFIEGGLLTLINEYPDLL